MHHLEKEKSVRAASQKHYEEHDRKLSQNEKEQMASCNAVEQVRPKREAEAMHMVAGLRELNEAIDGILLAEVAIRHVVLRTGAWWAWRWADHPLPCSPVPNALNMSNGHGGTRWSWKQGGELVLKAHLTPPFRKPRLGPDEAWPLCASLSGSLAAPYALGSARSGFEATPVVDADHGESESRSRRGRGRCCGLWE